MDLATIIGVVSGIVFIVISILLKGQLTTFFDAASIMITIGGTAAAMLISYPLTKFLNGLKVIRHAFHQDTVEEPDIINMIIDLANVARKEGLLALEEKAVELEDEFVKKGILLIVDGTEAELVRNVLETELVFIESRHKKNQKFWEDVATFGPAWGMIGTLIGLVNMLQQLEDPASVGPNMSVALLTTLYGSLLANFVANPIAAKLAERSDSEIATKELLIEGLLSILAGENPRIIEEKLKAFLAPSVRESIGAQEDAGEEVGA
ncbi:motility protein A [Vallitalea okinawensis]|uniref:motility protein A n=1 Tax=Vallitalea okinawensis TaxID=2078660 RepID=UPI000CFDC553|nr:MotA/TolQ/ExbB proton channel family protein [Vallitalea okinawensis]